MGDVVKFGIVPIGGEAWLKDLREKARKQFESNGFPTTRHEDWKYTNVAPIAAVKYSALPEGGGETSFDVGEGTGVLFVNGRFIKELGVLPKVQIGQLRNAFEKKETGVKEHFGRYASVEANAFVALNTALCDDGVFISIPDGVKVEKPIHLVFVSNAKSAFAFHPRILIVMGKGAQATIVENYIGKEAGPYFNNVVTEIRLGKEARLEHYKIQREGESAFHVATVHAHQAERSSLKSYSLSFGGALVRNDIEVVFGAEGGFCALNGLYVVGDEQHVDHHTMIDHAVSHCSSEEFYKGIAAGKATAVFNGKILVREGAQKTDAKQTNKNLLLSDEATIDSKPQLEIYANDVKCVHGAAVGKLDPEALFYLRSRGIDEKSARSLLTGAFANEVLERIEQEPVRASLVNTVRVHLEKMHA